MRTILFAIFLLLAGMATAPAQLEGDPKRGGQIYRACTACHSLQKDTHLTGPSLADLWGKKAGSIGSFKRYSSPLKASEIVWDENTLNAWLADPGALVPDNFMTFRGINDDKARVDLIAFLHLALVPGGAAAVVKQGLLDDRFANGQIPAPLSKAGPDQQVTAIRKCADTYFIKTANGREQPFWEMNVRLKTDTSESGPLNGGPKLAYAGMQGDRVSIVFSNTGQITSIIKEEC
jgi:cytochrome c